jgi:hypothetical protein
MACAGPASCPQGLLSQEYCQMWGPAGGPCSPPTHIYGLTNLFYLVALWGGALVMGSFPSGSASERLAETPSVFSGRP